MRIKRKLISLFCIATLTISSYTVVVKRKPIEVIAATEWRTVNMGTYPFDDISGTLRSHIEHKIYFGHSNRASGSNVGPGDALCFTVLSSNENNIYLDSSFVLKGTGVTSNVSHKAWSQSNDAKYLNTTFYNAAFNSSERNVINYSTLPANTYEYTSNDGSDSNQYTAYDEAFSAYIFSMSLEDRVTYYSNYSSDSMKADAYQTRTSLVVNSTNNTHAAVSSAGDFNSVSVDSLGSYYLSPAMNLDPNMIAFTKVAGYTTSSTFDVTNTVSDWNWTLAIYDTYQSFNATLTDEDPLISSSYGGTLNFDISATPSVIYDQVSALLVNSEGNVLMYGKVSDPEGALTNKDINIPAGYPAGDYSIYLFGEDVPDDGYSTTYVSNMMKFDFSIVNVYDFSVDVNDSYYPAGLTYNSDLIEQSHVSKIDSVTFTLEDGYYFPDNYSDRILQTSTAGDYYTSETLDDLGLTVSFNKDKSAVTVSGTLKKNANVLLPAASEKLSSYVTFDDYNQTYTYGDTNVKITAQAGITLPLEGVTIPTVKVRYVSSDTGVATIDKDTGKLTFKKPGKVKISAIVDEGYEYLSSDAISEEITVLPKDASDAKVSFIESSSHPYDENSWHPKFEVKDGEATLLEDIDYTIAYPEDTVSMGEKTFIINFIGSYKGSTSVKGTVTEAVKKEEPKAIFVMPKTPYTIKGEKGLNSYYISSVSLIAPDGYYISKSKDDGFGNSVSYKESTEGEVIYLMDATTHAVSDEIKVASLLIDTEAPRIVGVTSNQKFYGKSKTLVVSDEHLKKLTINGEAVSVNDKMTDITLSANNGSEEYEIYAMDEAGNEMTIKITIAEAWTEKGIIPSAEKVRLKRNISYTLSSGGEWTVQGDSTVYPGGTTFYIPKEGEYVFNKQ